MNKFKFGDIVVVNHEGPLRCVGWVGKVTQSLNLGAEYHVRFFSKEATRESSWLWGHEELTALKDTQLTRISPDLV